MKAHAYGKIRGMEIETNFDDGFKLHTLKGLPLSEFVIHCLVTVDSVAKAVNACEPASRLSTTKQASGKHGAARSWAAVPRQFNASMDRQMPVLLILLIETPYPSWR